MAIWVFLFRLEGNLILRQRSKKTIWDHILSSVGDPNNDMRSDSNPFYQMTSDRNPIYKKSSLNLLNLKEITNESISCNLHTNNFPCVIKDRTTTKHVSILGLGTILVHLLLDVRHAPLMVPLHVVDLCFHPQQYPITLQERAHNHVICCRECNWLLSVC